jgi:hypothetical protein
MALTIRRSGLVVILQERILDDAFVINELAGQDGANGGEYLDNWGQAWSSTRPYGSEYTEGTAEEHFESSGTSWSKNVLFYYWGVQNCSGGEIVTVSHTRLQTMPVILLPVESRSRGIKDMFHGQRAWLKTARAFIPYNRDVSVGLPHGLGWRAGSISLD